MGRWTIRRWPPQPTFPMTIAGHGRIHTHILPQQAREHFNSRHPDRAQWGVLFVHDDGKRPWTLYSPDPDYTAMFAPTAHQLTLTFELFTEKFPCWNKDWRIG